MERQLCFSKTVNVFLADLKRLAGLFSGISEERLACAFIAVLPVHVKQLLHTFSGLEDMTTNQLGPS